jgi:ABC-type Fe2+-enterobactin transport system substrate-binding protein
MHVPDEARPKVFVGWISKVKRNHYVTASSNLLRPPKSVMVSKIQNALLTLNQPSDGHNKILQALGVTGFELPDGNINSESIEEMADFLAILGDNTHCSRKNAN